MSTCCEQNAQNIIGLEENLNGIQYNMNNNLKNVQNNLENNQNKLYEHVIKIENIINNTDLNNLTILQNNTLNTDPISNAQSNESTLANVTLDAVQELTKADIVMVRGSHFLGPNSVLVPAVFLACFFFVSKSFVVF